MVPSTITADFDVVNIISSTKFFGYNQFFKKIHLFFILEINQDFEFKILNTMFLDCCSYYFSATKISIFNIESLMLSNIYFIIK